MPDTRIRIRKATALLREDHQEVKKLFSDYEELGEGAADQKAAIFEQIERELSVHAQIEEEIFYPAIETVEDEDAGELVREAHEEHKIMKTLLAELSGLDAGDEAFDAKMKVLQENVLHHAEEEQNDIFPLFDELERSEKDSVSERLAARKEELRQKE